MKHYNVHYLTIDDDELKYIIKLLSYFKMEEPLEEILLRMKQIAYPEQFPDPLDEFHKTIAYYDDKNVNSNENSK